MFAIEESSVQQMQYDIWYMYIIYLPKSPSFCRSFSSSMSKFLSLKAAAGLTKATRHPKASTCADAPTHIPHTADHHDLSLEAMS